MTTIPIVHDAGCASAPEVEFIAGVETGRIIIRPCNCSASRMTLTLVENRRLTRDARYTIYLNGEGCVELSCGPTVEQVYVEAQAALTPLLAALRDRSVETEIIESEYGETARHTDQSEPTIERSLTLAEYCQRYGQV